MNPMKRLGLVAVLVVGVTLVASTPTRAEDWGTIQLMPIGDEPQASGEATMTDVAGRLYKLRGKTMWGYWGTLSVTCHNLTPRTWYWTPAGTIKADRNGDGTVSGDVQLEWNSLPYPDNDAWILPFVVDVVRVNANGPGTMVLTGTFPAKPL